MLVDDNAYIHIMYASHGTAQKHSKSTHPQDISASTAMPDYDFDYSGQYEANRRQRFQNGAMPQYVIIVLQR
jgi:hypothetical protein